ncbi:hypothetical protein BCAR13_440103 [Paraburkholderia caribensis]|nr:hypothetical protein BCAR13_440103 [Paraburkholderia caribensis]
MPSTAQERLSATLNHAESELIVRMRGEPVRSIGGAEQLGTCE